MGSPDCSGQVALPCGQDDRGRIRSHHRGAQPSAHITAALIKTKETDAAIKQEMSLATFRTMLAEHFITCALKA